jgi:hypothetical protein
VKDQGWVAASDLILGDRLWTSDGSERRIVGHVLERERAPRFNLEVRDWHTYFVTAENLSSGLWVHNVCPRQMQHIVDEIHLARIRNHGNQTPDIDTAIDSALKTLQQKPTALTWFTHNGQTTFVVSSVEGVTSGMQARARELLGRRGRVMFEPSVPEHVHAELRGELSRARAGIPDDVPGHQVASHFACTGPRKGEFAGRGGCSRRLFGSGSETGRTESLFGIRNHTGSAASHDQISRSYWRNREALVEWIYNPPPEPDWLYA